MRRWPIAPKGSLLFEFHNPGTKACDFALSRLRPAVHGRQLPQNLSCSYADAGKWVLLHATSAGLVSPRRMARARSRFRSLRTVRRIRSTAPPVANVNHTLS